MKAIRIIKKHLVLLAALAIAGIAYGQTGGPYILTWSTIDGGGGRSSGGTYKLTGTIGQPDAAYSSGGNYELLGGFWPGGPLCIVNFYDFAAFALYWLETGSGLPADLDDSGKVDIYDLKLFVEHWLCPCPYNWPLRRPLCIVNFDDFARFAEYWLLSGSGLPADLNGDGKVDIYDLKLFVDVWLCSCPSSWPLK
jgi:hypothetical protein